MRCFTKFGVLILALPLAHTAFAQATSSGLTRAQVKAQLMQAENSNYDPTVNHIYYPRGKIKRAVPGTTQPDSPRTQSTPVK
ncbi:DUF4148 domain-containing protein [Caballeronia sp. LP006]|uniref:DUF4148 domain-containing protein n=1 Tax=Caballeronia sp. LP006 TaxID=3038552 RepID=UPI0038D3C03D